ncbi:MAG TPA: hypothetical protein VGK79_16465 [Gaiellaceae bacterium]
MDLATGQGTRVIDGNLFLLALPDPDPTKARDFHLVAYDESGKLIADDCPNCAS